MAPVAIDIPQTLDRLCYRYPSMLVDAIVEHETGRRLVAIKNVTVNEEFFQGHFPGTPLMPAVLMIESMAQAASVLLLQTADGSILPQRASLRGVDDAKFRKPVGPGDRVRLEARIAAGRAEVITPAWKLLTLPPETLKVTERFWSVLPFHEPALTAAAGS